MLPRPNAVLVAQAFSPDPATASFDAASPHDQWSAGCISIVAESPHVMLDAQAFGSDLAAASFDCAYGYPRSVGGVAIVLPRRPRGPDCPDALGVPSGARAICGRNHTRLRDHFAPFALNPATATE
jgi:hypothetical protein